MASIQSVQRVDVDQLIPYINNAKQHPEEQVLKIASSIREFGFVNPVLIDKDFNVIAGHGRILAAKKLGLTEVPCVFVEGLTDAQRKAYILADNRLGELGDWDIDLVTSELEILQEQSFDFKLTGFDLESVTADWFSNHERNDDSRQEGNDEYNEFLDKFEQPKTTDDCYTPDVVYDAVADWVSERYGYKRAQMIRPFYPGGDYQNEKYPEGCVVVDNPPFSILSEIRQWYRENGIKYFLFAPSLSCIGGNSAQDCSVAANVGVVYENKANVATSFVTNLESDYVIMSAPDLHKAVQAASDEYAQQFKNPMPKYTYPTCVITAAMAGYLSKYGQELKIRREDAFLIRELDAQKEQGKAIFGGGYLLSEKAAAEKAAAEKAAAEKAAATVWELSEREKEIVKGLGND
jgi:hypothetical protein